MNGSPNVSLRLKHPFFVSRIHLACVADVPSNPYQSCLRSSAEIFVLSPLHTQQIAGSFFKIFFHLGSQIQNVFFLQATDGTY